MGRVFTITEGLENMGALRSGGQGSVYKARRTGTIITAVKLLPTPLFSEDPLDRHFRDFQNEVEKLKKVNLQPNAHVVKILSSGVSDTGNFPFIEMEFIEGPDLEELLHPPHDPLFTLKEAIKVAEQLSSALAHCHRVGVKHGDVKSNNVKYNLHSANYVLLDFGLAVLSEEERRTSLRQAGAVEFMAPEQSEGRLLVQSDVYSYGVILYELLSGSVPFPLGENKGESGRNRVMVAHLEEEARPVGERRRENLPAHWSAEKKAQEGQVPRWLEELVHRCLEKKPEDRFSDGQALQEYLLRQTTPSERKTEAATQQLLQLQQQNNELEKELHDLKNNAAINYVKNNPKNFSGGKWLASLVTFAVLALLLFFILKKEGGNNQNNNVASANQPEKQRQVVGQYKVLAARAYFHNAPDPATKRAAYMIPSNDIIGALEDKNGFIYTEFTNSNGQTSKGWLRKQDVILLDDWNRNNKAQMAAKPVEQDIDQQLQQAHDMVLSNNISEALYIYSYLANQGVPQAMYEYGNLALHNQNDAIDCTAALQFLKEASDKGFAPAKRTLGFLYIFAENNDVLMSSNYQHCPVEKKVGEGMQLLQQAAQAGDSTAVQLLNEIKLRGLLEPPPVQ